MTVPATERAELEAFRDLWRGAPPALVSELGLARLERGGSLAVAAPAFAGALIANRVLGLGLAEPADDGLLDQLDAFFDAAGTGYGIALAPGARPADLPERLAARGFEPGPAWAKFEAEVGRVPAVATELRLERSPPAPTDDFVLAVAEGFGLPADGAGLFAALPGRPGWDCFVTYDDDEPVGAGALFAAGDAAWLGAGATRPAFRRRGSHGALVAARLARAAELGLRVAVSETGDRGDGRPGTSYANLERAGLAVRYVRPNLLSPGYPLPIAAR